MRKQTKAFFSISACLLCVHFFVMEVNTFAAEKQPNVLLLISDDLSPESLGCYGNPQCNTPNIDGLAEAGMRFNKAYCQYPVCGPSRAAMMAGMYPQSTGVISNGASDKFTQNMGDRPTMSQLFKQAGYYSARVSKIYHMRVPGDLTNGVSGPDHEASWTEYFNCPGPEWMTEGEVRHLSNEKLKMDPNKHYALGFGGAFYVVKGSSEGEEQPDTQAATKAIELLKAHQKDPFFLAVGFVRPHVPFVAPAPYFEPYPEAEMELAETIEGDQDDIPVIGRARTSQKMGFTDRPDLKKASLSAYYACVSYMDQQVGRVLNALEELGLRENTIVIFKSDHGYHLGEHEMWQKMSLHEESARIPLIIDAPGKKPGVSESLVQQIDLYPTVATLAGMEIPEHCQGKSLVPILENPKKSVHQLVYTNRKNGHLIRTQDWAYMQYDDGSKELYDMKNDPKQYTNQADNPEFAEQVQVMERMLKRKIRSITGKS
ncbi:Choline-sulfatase [Planctomycetales bacterium 10988]|nr:Choline-sulfatase [Planctomycetales bacterium 10988]